MDSLNARHFDIHGCGWTGEERQRICLHRLKDFQSFRQEFHDLVLAHNTELIVRHKGDGPPAIASTRQYDCSGGGDGDSAAGEHTINLVQRFVAQTALAQCFDTWRNPFFGEFLRDNQLLFLPFAQNLSNDFRYIVTFSDVRSRTVMFQDGLQKSNALLLRQRSFAAILAGNLRPVIRPLGFTDGRLHRAGSEGMTDAGEDGGLGAVVHARFSRCLSCHHSRKLCFGIAGRSRLRVHALKPGMDETTPSALNGPWPSRASLCALRNLDSLWKTLLIIFMPMFSLLNLPPMRACLPCTNSERK